MPIKQTILHRAPAATAAEARAWCAQAFDLKLITWRQLGAVVMLASRHLPCDLVLVQRMPKNTQYLTCITSGGDIEYRIGPRAEVYAAKPI